MSDRFIIKKLKQDDERAIEELIDKYAPYAAAIVYRISGASLKVEDMEEIVSDVFYAIWKRRHHLVETDSIKPYLAQTARNMTRNKWSRVTHEQPLDDDNLPFAAHTTDEMLIQREQVSIVKKFMDTLKGPDKEILTAYYFGNYKLEDIALMYKLPLSTVKSKIYRGRKAIINYFEERGY